MKEGRKQSCRGRCRIKEAVVSRKLQSCRGSSGDGRDDRFTAMVYTRTKVEYARAYQVVWVIS